MAEFLFMFQRFLIDNKNVIMFLLDLWRTVFSWFYRPKTIEYTEEEFQEVLFKETVQKVTVSYL